MPLPADDDPVPDGSAIYRLVKTDQCSVLDGQWEFQSGAFDNNEGDDMSSVLGDTLEALERLPDDLAERLFPDEADDWGIAVLEAGFLRRDEAQELRRTPNELERAHGDARGKKSPKRRKRLKKNAEWVRRPEAPPGPDADA